MGLDFLGPFFMAIEYEKSVEQMLRNTFEAQKSSELSRFLFYFCKSNPWEAQVLMRYGRWFSFRESRSLELNSGVATRSYQSAYSLSKKTDRFYCEGWTRVLVPNRTAWVCDSWGQVFGDELGMDIDDGLFGIVFRQEFVLYFRQKFNTQSLLNHPCLTDYLQRVPHLAVYGLSDILVKNTDITSPILSVLP